MIYLKLIYNIYIFMNKIDNVDYKILSVIEIKNVSDFFYNQYINCQKMGYNRGMNMENNPCNFLYKEYVKYENAYLQKKKEN